MKEIYKDIEKWLSTCPKWLQVSAKRLVENNNTYNDKDIQELTELCKKEISGEDERFNDLKINFLHYKENTTNIKLKRISNVMGINALAPKAPLEFHDKVTIIYGGNGSGKSSYVKFLKYITGIQSNNGVPNNVFKPEKVQQCDLTYEINSIQETVKFNGQFEVLDQLRAINLYDTDSINLYLNNENESTYEPWLLKMLTQLSNICVAVNEKINHEKSLIIPPSVHVPYNLYGTKAISWYNNLDKNTLVMEVEKQCFWDETDSTNLEVLKSKNSKELIESKINEYSKLIENAEIFYNQLKLLKESLNEQIFTIFNAAKIDYKAKVKITETEALKVLDGTAIDGIGTDTWKILWEKAREYSVKYAYPNSNFPNVTNDAVCVLCHQKLSEETKGMFISFESFIKSSLNSDVKSALEKINSLISELPNIPSIQERNLSYQLNAFSDEEIGFFEDYIKKINTVRECLIDIDWDNTNYPKFESSAIKKIEDKIASYKEELKKYIELKTLNDNEKIASEIIELEAKKFIHEIKKEIYKLIKYHQKISELETAIGLTKTTSISNKKAALSAKLITEEYILRFNKELEYLGAKNIGVELVKTRTTRGKVLHKIQLKGISMKSDITEVLSEGESRIVSLAGFLADVECAEGIKPFIFDDPISSLDQSFEEYTINRIAKLGLSRQLIVFSHRLSFIVLLQEALKGYDLNYEVICLNKEIWGAGEPGEIPIFAEKPEKALNKLLDERLNKAKKVYVKDGVNEYTVLAKGICSDFRIILERLIENNLLSDVVHRFRRSLITKNKIHNLAKINIQDCEKFEYYLTKYSKYEHSQSLELQVILPLPEELENDLTDIKNWIQEFKNRSIPLKVN